ncbi:15227_t:CDS:2 [Acaulospora colombiana]|uniref:15227_t:CDS:1 n=1 Tax=Acaulospora colombiana TaxID=27376 RepID=A0ACA9K6V5_9GLOM|nr:15227_t:CDS:2 [Acaulospora colombiana]
MRIKLEFEESLDSQRVWYPVTEGQKSKTVKDLENSIIRDFGLEEKCPNGIALNIEEFELLQTFNVDDLIRDNDLVRIKRRYAVVSERSKKRQRIRYPSESEYAVDTTRNSDNDDDDSSDDDYSRMVEEYNASSSESSEEETKKRKDSSSSSPSTSSEGEESESESCASDLDGGDELDEQLSSISIRISKAKEMADRLIPKIAEVKCINDNNDLNQPSMEDQQQQDSKSKATNQRKKVLQKNKLTSDNVATLNNGENEFNNNQKSVIAGNSQQGIRLNPPMSLSSTSNKRKGYFQGMKNKTPTHVRFTNDETKEAGGENSNANISSQEHGGEMTSEKVNEDEDSRLPSPRVIITRVDIMNPQQDGNRQQKRSTNSWNNQLAKNRDNNTNFNFNQKEGQSLLNNVNEDKAAVGPVSTQGREVTDDSGSYESMELYRGQPRTNDIIVYKVLEFSRSSFTPELSAYEVSLM